MIAATILVAWVVVLAALVWALNRRQREPTNWDRYCSGEDLRLDDIFRGSGRR